MRRFILWTVVALVAAGVPSAQATHEQADPAQQGPENAFGVVDWKDPYPLSEGERVPVTAQIQLKQWDGSEEMDYVLLAFNVNTDAVDVRLTDVQTPDGKDLPLHADDRDVEPRTPKVIVVVENLSNGTAVLKGTVEPSANGRFHLGAMAIGFDHDFAKLFVPAGYSAEVYGSAEVTAEGFSTGPLAPPFRGEGNAVHLPGPGVLLVVAGLWAAAWRVTAGARRP